ncbi:MAG: hypothetical protein ABWX67_03475 [Allosphingosinicella sp.]
MLAVATTACSPDGPSAYNTNGGQDQRAASAKAAAVPAIEEREYRGACDGSAAAMVSQTQFAAAYDEDNVIRIFPLSGGEAISRLDAGQYLGIGDGESDLEAAARIGNRIYWISSMGRNDSGEEKPERRRFFATDIVGPALLRPAGSQAEAAGDRLFRAIVATPELQQYNLQAASQLPTKTVGGLNIEGLAPTADGGLILAFRAPLRPLDPAGDRRAIVVTLANPGDVIAGQAAQFINAGDIRLGDRGIRSLEYRPDTGDYLILAGAFDEESRFALFRWTGRLADEPVQLDADLDPLNPESLSLLSDGRLLVLSDDGEVQVDGRKCKSNRTPAERRSFRARVIRLD